MFILSTFDIVANAIPASTSRTDAVVNKTYEQIGKPYVWGGKGPNSFDCSGLVQYVYQNAIGVYLEGYTHSLKYSGQPITNQNDLRPGDLIFPYSDFEHVAIYVGNGQIIHAPRTGENVKKVPIYAFYTARRIEGFIQNNGSWKYLENSKYKTGWIKEYGDWYYFHDNGSMATGWTKLNWAGEDRWYYFNGDGMVSGWAKINWAGEDRWYYFNGNGMVSGLQYLEWNGTKNWYYFNGNGLYYGWIYLEKDGQSNWYYFDGNGMAKNRTIDGHYVNNDGIRVS